MNPSTIISGFISWIPVAMIVGFIGWLVWFVWKEVQWRKQIKRNEEEYYAKKKLQGGSNGKEETKES